MRSMRSLIILLSLVAFSFGVAQAGGGNPETADGGVFVHIVRNDGDAYDNTDIHMSSLVSEYPRANTSPMTDSNSPAIIFATNNVAFSTGNQADPFRMMYSGGTWRIANATGTHFGANDGQAFNIQVQGPGHNVFIHTAQSASISSNYTIIDHLMTNNNPNALVSVTMGEGTSNPHQIGVFYSNPAQKWAIFNQDFANMPVGAMFNVQVLKDTTVDFKHVATVGTIVQSFKTELNHPLLNGNINAKLIVTQRWTSVYNNNPIGVDFDNASQKWRIVNTNGAAMPVDAEFNVHIAGAYADGDGVLVNGGFEAQSPSDSKQPIVWNTAPAGEGSKRICSTYHPITNKPKTHGNTGECSYLIKGAAGQIRKLVQSAPVSTTDGGIAAISLWAYAYNVTDLTVKVKVGMSDGTKVSFKLDGASLNGTYAWTPITGSLLLPPTASATSFKVVVKLIGTSKIYIDDVMGTVKH